MEVLPDNEWDAPAGDGHDCESRLRPLPRLRTSRICTWRADGNASGKGIGVKDCTGGDCAPPVFVRNAEFSHTVS